MARNKSTEILAVYRRPPINPFSSQFSHVLYYSAILYLKFFRRKIS